MAPRRLAGLLLLLAGPAAATVTLTPVADIDFGSWNPAAGDLSGSSSFCVASTQGGAGGGSTRDYRVRATPQTSVAFELINTLDPAQTIAIQIHVDDLLTPSSEQLAPSAWSARDKQGVASCAPIQLNAQVRVEIDALNLSQVASGLYQGLFALRAGASGNDEDTFLVSVTITESSWIQRLDPIGLTYSLGSDATGNEPFCIWSSTGAYDITISSRTPTASTTFVATGQAVPANTVSFGVQFDTDADASDGAAVTEGSTIVNQSPARTGLPASCLADNAGLYVRFPASSNLDAAPADTYADELTLLVEPR